MKKIEPIKDSELTLEQVVSVTGIPRRSVMRHCSRFSSFVQRRIGRSIDSGRRIMIFEVRALDNLKLIRDLSRHKLSEKEILAKLKLAVKDSAAGVRIREKVMPLIEELKRRPNSLLEVYDISDDFSFADLEGAVDVLESSVLGLNLPITSKSVGMEVFDQVLFLMNMVFYYYFRENLSGNHLKKRVLSYWAGSMRVTEEMSLLQDYLIESMNISGRWGGKDKKRVRFIVYELIEVLGLRASDVISLITECRLAIKIPIPHASEVQNYWWQLVDSILACKRIISRSGVGDKAVGCVVRIWEQRIEL